MLIKNVYICLFIRGSLYLKNNNIENAKIKLNSFSSDQIKVTAYLLRWAVSIESILILKYEKFSLCIALKGCINFSMGFAEENTRKSAQEGKNEKEAEVPIQVLC